MVRGIEDHVLANSSCGGYTHPSWGLAQNPEGLTLPLPSDRTFLQRDRKPGHEYVGMDTTVLNGAATAVLMWGDFYTNRAEVAQTRVYIQHRHQKHQW